ncbi:MAG: replication-relaxation family protein [Pseudonocardiaceae bacterium]
MITNPTRQRALRGHQATRPIPRAANTAEHRAVLAARLTPRDRWIIRMLHEHRVLTSCQITALAFPSSRSARQRLRELYCWSVLDRFAPFISVGTAPMHYVLAPAGAAVLAAEDGRSVKDLSYHHDRAFGIAHSLRLAHTIGVNDWFTALIAAARHDPDLTLDAWWSETRCARHFADLTKPDAYGRWRAHGREIEFFLEYDFGTEALDKLASKLHGYAALTATTAITTPVLVWLPTALREAAARHQLTRAWQHLQDPRSLPVATAAADLLHPHTAHPSPADSVWLPLDCPGGPTARRALHDLPAAWPHVPPFTTPPNDPTNTAPPTSLPAPDPMPPATPSDHSRPGASTSRG